MSDIKQMEKDLKIMDANLRQGERFAELGYDCEMMMCITRRLRDELAAKIERAKNDANAL